VFDLPCESKSRFTVSESGYLLNNYEDGRLVRRQHVVFLSEHRGKKLRELTDTWKVAVKLAVMIVVYESSEHFDENRSILS